MKKHKHGLLNKYKVYEKKIEAKRKKEEDRKKNTGKQHFLKYHIGKLACGIFSVKTSNKFVFF